MQEITFKKIILKNVRRYTDFEFEFSKGLVCISGRNGKGKSTIFHSLMAVLYGETAEGDRISDLVNLKVGKNLEIHLYTDIDSDEYVFTRYYLHKKFQNNFIITKNKKCINEGLGIDRSYELIKDLLIPKDVFKNTILFGQQIKDFFTALNDSKQKIIFNAILSLEEFKTYYERTKIKLDKIEKQIEDDNNRIVELNVIIPEKGNLVTKSLNDKKEKLKEVKERIEELAKYIFGMKSIIKQNLKSINDISYDENEHKKILNKITKSGLEWENSIQSLNTIDNELEQEKSEAFEVKKVLNDSIKIKFEKEAAEAFYKIKKIKDSKIQVIMEEKNNFSKINNTKDLEQEYTNIKDERTQLIANIQDKIIKLSTNLKIKELNKRRDSSLQKLQEELISLEQNEIRINTMFDNLKTEISKFQDSICPTCNRGFKNIECPKCNYILDDSSNHIELELKEKKKSLVILESDLILVRKSIKDKKQKIDIDQKHYEQILYNEESSINKEVINFQKRIDGICFEIDLFNKEYSIKINDRVSEIKLKIIEFNIFEAKFINEIKIEEIDYKEKIKQNNNLINNEFKTWKDNLDISFTEKNKKLKEDTQKNIGNLKKLLYNLKEENISLEARKEKVFLLRDRIVGDKSIVEEKNSEIIELQKFKYDDTFIEIEKEVVKKLEKEKVLLSKNLKVVLKKIDILNFWKEGFSDRGIKSMLIDNAIPFLNSIVKEELEKIAPGKFIVSFDTLSETKTGDIKDKFSVNILNLETGANKHSQLSGGEKRIIDVCCMRALKLLAQNLYQKKFNNTLLDEVLDSLDSENAYVFCRILKKLSVDQNITIISHTFNNTIESDHSYQFN